MTPIAVGRHMYSDTRLIAIRRQLAAKSSIVSPSLTEREQAKYYSTKSVHGRLLPDRAGKGENESWEGGRSRVRDAGRRDGQCKSKQQREVLGSIGGVKGDNR